MHYRILYLIVAMSWPCIAFAGQSLALDSTAREVTQLPEKYLGQVRKKTDRVASRVGNRTDKALKRLVKQENAMQAKLNKIDSVAAKNIFTTSIAKLNSLRFGLKGKVAATLPIGGNADLDTLENSLKFLNGSKALLGSSLAKLKGATNSLQELRGRLQQVEDIKAYIREHKQQLREQLKQYTGFTKGLQKMNKEAYYYGQQVNEYKSLLKDKKKAEAKALALLKKMPAYSDFIQKHSQLGSLFGLIASGNVAQSVEGLQTRTQVEQLVQQRIGNTPAAQQAVNQAMDQARSQFSELKSKFPDLDNSADMPDFKPNPLKAKSLLQRMEFAWNIQFQKSSKYFPTYADIAGQIAYKFHKNGSLGVGIAYKLAMGKGWDHISFGHLGLGFRSFLDWRIRGTFFINGGFEENYQNTFTSLNQLKSQNMWRGSALLGLSKKYQINPKLKGNIMVLYDFLAPRQLPKTDAIKVRIGYNF
jgi:DNA repair exonuclease SbcCD ATPase subunit